MHGDVFALTCTCLPRPPQRCMCTTQSDNASARAPSASREVATDLLGHFLGLLLTPVFPWVVPHALWEGGVVREGQVGLFGPWAKGALQLRDFISYH